MAKRKTSKKHLLRHLSPRVYKTILLAGAAVMFWRGTWGLLDLYLFPQTPAVSYVISLGISLLLLLPLTKYHIEKGL